VRHYDFGSSTTPGSVKLVSLDGTQSLPMTATWGQLTITATVPAFPTSPAAVAAAWNCPVQQQTLYGGSPAKCGQLVITNANGRASVDTVTVTVGGKAPTALAGKTIQAAIDAANPGDMIIIPPGIYHELLLMWKPVRLQGVGAASTIINADTHPAGQLLDAWRQQLVCLFGLTPDGQPRVKGDTSCSSTWNLGRGQNDPTPDQPTLLVDRLPFEATLGWDATLNGNLAEQLIEPSLMGAYEGAAITVLGKGVVPPPGLSPAAVFGAGAGEAAFPDGSRLAVTTDCLRTVRGTTISYNPYPTNFYCNPSSIDGLGLRNSSQGGGGIFVHAYAHLLQIANNRIFNNMGSLSGGITLGQGEHIEVPLGGVGVVNLPPGSCEASFITNLALPFCYNMRVNVHNNSVTLNSSLGDEMFSSTPAGAGGVSVNTGADYYRFANNWVCGNMSTGDGGGVSHVGFSKNGTIEHNAILFNQSTNPTITTNGGGLLVMGAPDVDPTTCGVNTDKDCVPPNPADVGPSDGTGFGLQINANLILGNSADSGSGGGLRLQHVNGNDVLNFPNGTLCIPSVFCLWNSVNVTNNIIGNNVAGWDGAGVSLLDALAVNIVNNTIVSNDSTASSGVLFDSLFAPLASSPGTNCRAVNNDSQSCPQPAGIVSLTNSPVLQANIPTTGFSCPMLHGSSGSCRYFSSPLLYNNVVWQNRAFFIGVGGFGTGNQSQQKLVTLYDAFTTNPAASQPQAEALTANGTGGAQVITGGTGACVSGSSYWDFGVRGDTGPSNHTNGGSPVTLRLTPNYSVITDPSLYPGANNTGGNPRLLNQYCNGSRVPPELGSMGYTVNPGTNETNALPTPVFSLTASATVDEGNNWINMRWGPLSLVNTSNGNLSGQTLGNYGPASDSSVIGYIAPTSSAGTIAYMLAPPTDFYDTQRKTNNAVDAGAVEFVGNGGGTRAASVTPSTLAFGNWARGLTSTPLTVTVTNTGTLPLSGGTYAFGGGTPQPFARAGGGAAGTCGASGSISLAPAASCTINVVFSRGATTTPASFTRTLTVTFTGVTVTGSPVTLTGTSTFMSVNPAALTFGNVTVGATSPAQTLTVRNSSGSTRALTIPAIAAPFARSGGSCGATLANNSSCTINVVYHPTAAGPSSGSVAITTNGVFTVANAPVPLSGTGQ
jgi:hypothetical protein